MRVCILDTSGDGMGDMGVGYWRSVARDILVEKGHDVVFDLRAPEDINLVIAAHHSDLERVPDSMWPKTAFVTIFPGFRHAEEIVAKGLLYIGDKPLTGIGLRRCISQILSKVN